MGDRRGVGAAEVSREPKSHRRFPIISVPLPSYVNLQEATCIPLLAHPSTHSWSSRFLVSPRDTFIPSLDSSPASPPGGPVSAVPMTKDTCLFYFVRI